MYYKSEHGCCDHKITRKMTYVEKKGIFLGGWLFAFWEGRVGMRKKEEK